MGPRAVVLTMLAFVASSEALAGPGDEVPIRQLVSAYEAAWNKRDAAGVVATFASDADVVGFDGPRVVGRDAIRKTVEDQFATTPATMRISLSVTSTRQLSQDVVIAETIARFSEGPVRENRGTSVIVRQSGRWLCAALRVYPAERP